MPMSSILIYRSLIVEVRYISLWYIHSVSKGVVLCCCSFFFFCCLFDKKHAVNRNDMNRWTSSMNSFKVKAHFFHYNVQIRRIKKIAAASVAILKSRIKKRTILWTEEINYSHFLRRFFCLHYFINHSYNWVMKNKRKNHVGISSL